MRVSPVSAFRPTFAVAPTRAVSKDKSDDGPQPFQPAPTEEPRTWAAGDHLPPMYVQPRFRISEPSLYDLAPEPFGYRYVRVRDHIYLAQLETGYVRDVITAPLP